MQRDSKQFLYELLETPSPSGYEQAIQRVVKKRVRHYAEDVSIDVHGNLIAALNPDAPLRVMLAGHCDQIGFMISHIDEQGYLYVKPIGGIDASVVPGSNIEIHTKQGMIPGVIGYTPVHLVSQADRGKKIELSSVWIDIGVADGAEAKRLVTIGDPVTFALGVTELGKDRIAAVGCDDRVGAFVVMETLRLVAEATKKSKKKLPVGVFAVSTVQEEIGLRGARTAAYGIDPAVGIAVDVTHASDNPGADAKKVGTLKLGRGPAVFRGPNINPVVEDLLMNTAKKKKIDVQPLSAAGATGTDANAIQINRAGVAAALVGIPNRYMHTQVEVVDVRDLEAAAKLLSQAILSMTAKMTFIPS